MIKRIIDYRSVLWGLLNLLLAQAAFSEPIVLVNHLGFTPNAGKVCVVNDESVTTFEVIHMHTKKPVFQGSLVPTAGDFGDYRVGDFSALTQAGIYYIQAGKIKSTRFRIADDVYDFALKKIVHYFRLQRCGPSKTGYHAPCHLEDGVRVDNRKPQDTSGGWHDASDLRKWVGATIYGMIGLSQLKETLDPDWDGGQIPDELKWGNRYFLSMQEPNGSVMHNCGGDIFVHGDMNHWTDNKPGTEDDRLIQTKPAPIIAHFNFIQAQMAMVRLNRDRDKRYAERCKKAALRCLEWLQQQDIKQANDLGAGIDACLQLYQILGQERFQEIAIKYAKKLIALQITQVIDKQNPVLGFFLSAHDNPEPDRQISRGCWHLIALCHLAEALPDHPDAPLWRKTVARYTQDYLARMTQRNAFGIVPYGFYRGENPGGNRRIGNYYYRWFMKADRKWWVGINANLASAGVGLVKASRLLKQPQLAQLAQRQLDWILGVNPFNASTVMGIGRNQPAHFLSTEFDPPTPEIPGAVMNGIGGTVDDRPALNPGTWQTCEYWTPMIGYTLWLLAEFQANP